MDLAIPFANPALKQVLLEKWQQHSGMRSGWNRNREEVDGVKKHPGPDTK